VFLDDVAILSSVAGARESARAVDEMVSG
jgi:hypothetical protein